MNSFFVVNHISNNTSACWIILINLRILEILLMVEEERTVVLDMGSFKTRAGLAGDDYPVIGTFTAVTNNDDNADQLLPSDSSVIFPVVRGAFTDVVAVEKIWNRVLLKGLEIDPANYNLVLSEHELIPASNREKMSEMCFETFNFRSFLLQPQSVLALYCSGRLTGLSVTLGYQSTRIVPVYHGLPIIHGITIADFGGKELTSYFGKLLNDEHSYTFISPEEKNCLRLMTERHSYVTLDCETEISCNYDRYMTGWELPNGNYIDYGPERCKVGEALFNPSVLNVSSPGLADLVFQSIQKCPEELRQEMLQNIIVGGAVAKMSGVCERLTQDLKALVASTNYKEVKVIRPTPEPDCSAWIGGSIIGSLSQREYMAMTLEDYNEVGAKGVHRFFMSHV